MGRRGSIDSMRQREELLHWNSCPLVSVVSRHVRPWSVYEIWAGKAPKFPRPSDDIESFLVIYSKQTKAIQHCQNATPTRDTDQSLSQSVHSLRIIRMENNDMIKMLTFHTILNKN